MNARKAYLDKDIQGRSQFSCLKLYKSKWAGAK